MQKQFHIISAKECLDILTTHSNEIVKLVKKTYLDFTSGRTSSPRSYFLRFPEKPDSRIIALPGYISTVSGIKWIASYPKNIENNMPRASAVIILNDKDTGYPICLIEGSWISAYRTAASAVLAAYYINDQKHKSPSLSIVGTGLIAETILSLFFKKGWEFDQIYIHDISLKRADRFKAKIEEDLYSNLHITTLKKALKSDLIVFATTALKPYITDSSAFDHNPKVLNISLRDISPDLILKSDNIVDDIDHVLNAKTSPHLAYELSKSKDFIQGNLSDCIEGKLKCTQNKPIVFSPMGLGVLDLSLGEFVFNHAVKNNNTIHLDNFFYVN